ncbi:MAG: N-6 DNA methylase [Phoenicibacter congonensis]|uniref:site-specific DNA-methyltransferase (adenine-specific) n=1 Tax=Phoenicibacter congonensis TaxID=1944646 RepID=A0AA43RHB8_9ACTN|nr:N-6 DNA methylase [Phoenicibacter congonensis]
MTTRNENIQKLTNFAWRESRSESNKFAQYAVLLAADAILKMDSAKESSVSAEKSESAKKNKKAVSATSSEGESSKSIAELIANDCKEEAVSKIANFVAEGNDAIAEFMTKNLEEVNLAELIKIANDVDPEDVRQEIARGPMLHGLKSTLYVTRPIVAKLALKILEIEPGDRVLDLGSGVGNFLQMVAQEEPETERYGIEIEPSVYACAVARAKHSNTEIDYTLGDAFAMAKSKIGTGKFDKALSNYPQEKRLRNYNENYSYFEDLDQDFAGFRLNCNIDWAFNRLLADAINEDGMAVAMTSASTVGLYNEANIRRYFIENGLIQAVIALPKDIYGPGFYMNSCMLVLGHGATAVRFVDATDLNFTDGKTAAHLDEVIEEIMKRLRGDSERSNLVEASEIARKNWDLRPQKYVEKLPVPCPTPFNEVIKNITRGVSIRKGELEALTTTENTGIYYVSIENINDGIIGEFPTTQIRNGKSEQGDSSVEAQETECKVAHGSLRCLKEVTRQMERYKVKTGDLLMSKMAGTNKIAVADVPKGCTMIASSNLYIIKLDQKKIDPFYLAAFFATPQGAESLERASVGSKILTISAKELTEINIPLEDGRSQAEAALSYELAIKQIREAKQMLQKGREELTTAFDMKNKPLQCTISYSEKRRKKLAELEEEGK